ncbi:hypothetical protein VZO05_12175 [Aggregatilineales bacterium SYSU G02658]
MSKQQWQVTLEQLNAVLDTLDALHDAAADHEAETTTGLSRQELMSFLRDVLYVTQETMKEVQRHQAAPPLRVLPKAERVS